MDFHPEAIYQFLPLIEPKGHMYGILGRLGERKRLQVLSTVRFLSLETLSQGLAHGSRCNEQNAEKEAERIV